MAQLHAYEQGQHWRKEAGTSISILGGEIEREEEGEKQGRKGSEHRCNLALLESPAPCGKGITDSHSRAVWTSPLNKRPLSTLRLYGQVGE
jgi:hypothetical protein